MLFQRISAMPTDSTPRSNRYSTLLCAQINRLRTVFEALKKYHSAILRAKRVHLSSLFVSVCARRNETILIGFKECD